MFGRSAEETVLEADMICPSVGFGPSSVRSVFVLAFPIGLCRVDWRGTNFVSNFVARNESTGSFAYIFLWQIWFDLSVAHMFSSLTTVQHLVTNV